MHKINIFPLGNADCSRIDLANGRKIVFDYADTCDPGDEEDRRCDLSRELREDLKAAGRDYYDVVAFTHLDKDHYQGASEFFWLDHAKEYQGNDRIRIKTLWVPAAVMTETSVEDPEGSIIQREARYRFKQGKGVRVFSRPDRLGNWCGHNGIRLEDRRHLITDAGQLTPEFSLKKDGVEFFVHSPFAKRINETEVEDRNDDALVMQATFVVGGVETQLLLMSDVTHEIIADIVFVTRNLKKRPSRLAWDIVKLPHHCSYLSLGPNKDDKKTKPVPDVAWLYENQGEVKGILVATSKPVPHKGSPEDRSPDPPHRQAANYYQGVGDMHEGDFVVTMAHPSKAAPKPVVIEIDSCKATFKKPPTTAVAAVTSARAPRAGAQ